MRTFLRKVLLFFLVVVIVDLLFGVVFQYMNDHSKGGGVKSRYYVCKESNEDVLIFGSSRAKHHYVPDIIEDSLKLSCYNTGEDGNGIIYCYGVLKMITSRYTPKLIVYDVSGYDIYQDDNMKYLDLMKPYYYETGIDSIFWRVEPKTRLMMLSNIYRFNTTCLRVAGNFFRPMAVYPKGYSALTGVMNYEPILNEEASTTQSNQKVDSLKLAYFERFILTTKELGITLVCCVSPTYKGKESDPYYNPIEQLCNKYDIPFLYYGGDKGIVINKELFLDKTHMNNIGATSYSCRIGGDLKRLFKYSEL